MLCKTTGDCIVSNAFIFCHNWRATTLIYSLYLYGTKRDELDIFYLWHISLTLFLRLCGLLFSLAWAVSSYFSNMIMFSWRVASFVVKNIGHKSEFNKFPPKYFRFYLQFKRIDILQHSYTAREQNWCYWNV